MMLFEYLFVMSYMELSRARKLGRKDRGMDKIQKRIEINKRFNDSDVADNLDARTELLQKVDAGEMTLAEAQKSLRKLKRDANRNNKPTVYGG